MRNISVVVLIAVLMFTGIAYGESISFSVSCTIPAIPGVNAPPFAETQKPIINQGKETQNDSASQEDRQKEPERQMLMAEEKTNSSITQTVYSR